MMECTELEGVPVEIIDIEDACEIEIDNTEVSVNTSTVIGISDDQQLLKDEIKEEEMEDADVSQEISQQGKRLLLKDWLEQKLNNEENIDTLSWYNKAEGLFKIKWLHKATDSWEVMADGALFKDWCIHTGKYDASNENPRKWKANFRCALNSLPDVIIVPSLCVRKGKDAYRVFKMLPEKIPEKVREKQESSRKRRKEKREILLKAYAKSQADAGNVEKAASITKQMELNMNNIRIHLKKTAASGTSAPVSIISTAGGQPPAKIHRILPAVPTIVTANTSKGEAPAAGTKAKTGNSTGGPKTALNGMDALCTAAAMMADDDVPEDGTSQSEDANVVAVVTTAVTPTAAGDVVTYYRPVGSVQMADRESKATPSPAVKKIKSSMVRSANPIPILPGLPVFRSVAPAKIGTTGITTSTGNMLLSVRLTQGATVTASSPPKFVQTGVPISQIQVPHIQTLPPGVCIQPFCPTTIATAGQQPTYLIPKNLLQQQIAASAGNQPARVFTIKPTNIAPSGKLLMPETMSAAGDHRVLVGRLAKAANSESSPAVKTNTQRQFNHNIVASPQHNIVATPQILSNIDYAHLKANISRLLDMEGSALLFQLVRHTELIKAVRFYDSEKPSVEVALVIAPDYTYTILVHNRSLMSSHELLKKQGKTIKSALTFKHVVERLNEHVTCIGSPEEMAHRQYTDYSSFISAYQEPDMGAKNPVLRYHSTIRSNGCQLLIKSPGNVSSLSDEDAKESYRCDECSRMRTHVLSMRGLFSLLDGSKVPDTHAARRKRLKLLKEYTSKEVLANRVDLLETQIKRFQHVLPAGTKIVGEVESVDDSVSSLPTVHVEAGVDSEVVQGMQSVDTAADTTYVTTIADDVDCNTAESEMITVTLAPSDSTDATNELTTHNSYTVLVDDNTTANSDIMLVTNEDNMPTTENLLEELANSTLNTT